MLKMGFKQRVVTPDLSRPVFLAGEGLNRRAESVRDDLWVKALALIHDQTRLVLVTVDCIGLARQHCQEVEERVRAYLGSDISVIIVCSGTHSGPDTIGLWGPDPGESGVDPDYMMSLKGRIIITAIEALQNTNRAVEVRAASIPVSGMIQNTREDGIVDEDLLCLQVGDSAGAAATLMVYSCNPAALPGENTALSADYVHALRRDVESASGAPCLFLPGPYAGTAILRQEGAESMGMALAAAGLAALKGVDFAPVDALEMQRSEVTLPLENPLLVDAMQQSGLSPQFSSRENLITEAALLKIGGCWLAFLPGELSPSVGIALKERCKALGAFYAGVICLANDSIGTILPEEGFIFPEDPANPGDHLCEMLSTGPQAGTLLLAALEDLAQAQ